MTTCPCSWALLEPNAEDVAAGRSHECTLEVKHQGDHRCKCGDRFSGVAIKGLAALPHLTEPELAVLLGAVDSRRFPQVGATPPTAVEYSILRSLSTAVSEALISAQLDGRRRRADVGVGGRPVSDDEMDPRMVAGVDLLGRAGAQVFRVGHSDEEDGDPVVWYAVATWSGPKAGGFKVRGRVRSEAAGGMDPVTAVMRLCEQVLDGGECSHCHRRTVFDAEMADSFIDHAMGVLGACVYSWDPELRTFRRGCEGDAP